MPVDQAQGAWAWPKVCTATATAQPATAALVQWRREEGSLPLTPAIEHLDERTPKALNLAHWGNVSAPGARRASFVTRAPPVDCCH